MAIGTNGQVHDVEDCALRLLADARWDFADQQASAIADYWSRRRADNPALFNGAVMVCQRHALAGGCFTADLVRTDFASFLFWREHGHPDRSVRDVFGSALVRSRDGAILLGRAGAHTINAGRYYLPAGFIDQSDVRADGAIDIAGSIARELREEAGLGPPGVHRTPGFRIVFSGPMTAIVAPYEAALTATELRNDVLAHIASDPAPELDGVILARSSSDLAGLALTDYMQVLASHLFGPQP